MFLNVNIRTAEKSTALPKLEEFSYLRTSLL
nr:MAG TPA: hypothetical protein [Bacteriophage sp.]DAU72081.1 MAG TPA: hypothetical protein [Caudoviricetes sp.]